MNKINVVDNKIIPFDNTDVILNNNIITFTNNGDYYLEYITSNNVNITLYAVWTANTSATKKYSVKFNANGGVGTMSDLTCIVDSSCTLSTNTFEKTGSIFKGWNTKKDGTGTNYSDKATVKNLATTDGGTVTLYAKWIGDKTDDEITNNSKTGDIMMFMAWTVGIGALAYTVYYYKTRKEN